MWEKDDLTAELVQLRNLRTRLRLNGRTIEFGVPILVKTDSSWVTAANSLSWRLHELHRLSDETKSR